MSNGKENLGFWGQKNLMIGQQTERNVALSSSQGFYIKPIGWDENKNSRGDKKRSHDPGFYMNPSFDKNKNKGL